MSFRKRNERKIQKDPSGINGLMSDFMQRHGFERQVTSAMLVQKANELFQEQLPQHAKTDIRVISFSEGVIKIAVRHAAAKHESAIHAQEIGEKLIRFFPNIEILKFIHVIDPKTFDDWVK